MKMSRVVVLVDASPDALQALDSAAELARRHGLPLLAVSVEEPERSRSSAYAFAQEVGAVSGSIRSLADRGQEVGRRQGMSGLRRAVERAGRQAEVAWELVVLQGRLVEEVLALSRPGDVLLLGRVGFSARLGRKLGGTALALARRAAGTVHLCAARPPPRLRGRVAVLIEGNGLDRELLALSLERARVGQRELVVLLAPAAADQADPLADMLDQSDSRWRLRTLPAMGTGELLRALAEEGAVELVIGRDRGWLNSPAAERLLARWPMPLIVAGRRDDRP
jgi:nucleotide-binding universal stress UspA family protein